MTVEFIPAILPHDKTITVRCTEENGRVREFRFSRDMPRNRIIAILPQLINASKRRGKRNEQE
jgi:hypothetical protein